MKQIFCLEFPLFSKSILYAWFFQLTVFEIVLSVLKEPHTPEVVLYLTFISHRCTHKPHLTSTFRPREGAKSDLIPTCMRMCPFICLSIFTFSFVGLWLNGFTNTLKKYIGWIFFPLSSVQYLCAIYLKHFWLIPNFHYTCI